MYIPDKCIARSCDISWKRHSGIVPPNPILENDPWKKWGKSLMTNINIQVNDMTMKLRVFVQLERFHLTHIT